MTLREGLVPVTITADEKSCLDLGYIALRGRDQTILETLRLRNAFDPNQDEILFYEGQLARDENGEDRYDRMRKHLDGIIEPDLPAALTREDVAMLRELARAIRDTLFTPASGIIPDSNSWAVVERMIRLQQRLDRVLPVDEETLDDDAVPSPA